MPKRTWEKKTKKRKSRENTQTEAEAFSIRKLSVIGARLRWKWEKKRGYRRESDE